jgi:hypothetical protein
MSAKLNGEASCSQLENILPEIERKKTLKKVHFFYTKLSARKHESFFFIDSCLHRRSSGDENKKREKMLTPSTRHAVIDRITEATSKQRALRASSFALSTANKQSFSSPSGDIRWQHSDRQMNIHVNKRTGMPRSSRQDFIRAIGKH